VALVTQQNWAEMEHQVVVETSTARLREVRAVALHLPMVEVEAVKMVEAPQVVMQVY
jgi:hypothetical protein